MRKIGKVKYNGKSTADLGVIVSGEAAFDAAAPDYTSYQIPGKNGDLMLSNNRYLNIDVTYPAFIPADFEEKVQAIRNWMRSARSYARIEDNYDLLHFRLGMGKDVLPFEPSAENVGSNMSLVFDCKPQRFLYSGEGENQIGVWGPVQTASGDVVTFEDDENGAFKSIAASITPTQDLHGYDYPWPAGGGENVLVSSDATSTVNGITVTGYADGKVTISGTATADAQIQIWSGTITAGRWGLILKDSINGSNSTWWVSFSGVAPIYSGKFNSYPADSELSIHFRVNVMSGVTVNETVYPMVAKTSVEIPYAPYSNICPITGETEATVWRTGKNMCEFSNTTNQNRGNYSYQKEEAADIEVIKERGGGSFLARFVMHMKEGHEYTFSMREMTNNGEAVGATVYVYSDELWGERVVCFTLPASTKNAKYTATTTGDVVIGVYDSNASIGTAIVLKKFMVCLSTAPNPTTYEPYLGSSYPISWQSDAGTVYGGSVDVVSGVLTVEWATTDLGLYTWNYSESAGAFYCGISTMKYYSSQTPIISALCSAYPNVGKPYLELGDKQLTTNMYGFSNSQKYCIIKDSAYTDAAEFKAAMSGVQFVYALATPQTYQLSGQHIKTLLGLNNVWADSGTVTAEWGEDPFGLYNPTLFDALPLIKVKNPQNGCAVTVNGTTMTCSRRYTGTVIIDCELMNVYSGATNLNADWSKDFPVLSPGENSVTFSGADAVTIIPRWWEL